MKNIFLGLILVGWITTASSARVLTGIDVLEKSNFQALDGARVALITNQTGQNRRGESTVDLLHDAKNVDLKCILTPEHGFRGTVGHGQDVQDSVDPQTGVPIYSLYGKTTRPTGPMLNGIDTLVYDIQDIGTRFYTYITTMAQAMEEASKRNIRFVVLDRPNPLRGDIFEGDVLSPTIKRFTGYVSVPTRYGLTVGEVALWYNKKQSLDADLSIIKMKNWERDLWFDETELPFVAPSPNIRNLTAALLYPGIGSFEATNVSVGRGTESPFEIFGAPWIKGIELCAYLREKNFSGVLFKPVVFTPKKDLYKGERCEGVQMLVTDRERLRPFQVFLASFLYLSQAHPTAFKPDWEEVKIVTGSRRLEVAVKYKKTFDLLVSQYAKTTAEFKTAISSFHLYK